jgi:hypothetical protein
VHFVCPATLAHRAAIVVSVVDRAQGECHLFVFGLPDDGGFAMWTGIVFSQEAIKETWHWIEKA